ncbi:putative transcription factor Znf-LSD family [Helianthus annuus]|uniref:Transcription factor Znf-LSD family n=1 Tax=Helianthus annuus TaxID=4232 RepID=A0A9K3I028_HELAN|nr:putative transcription factor Znf-LSD family [Helianthus annuus]KAJ0514825.1 putative transcription factor Znf-LSD family [Helianthus annuus]KAJ0523133.1 putative transcription factor Znf-LSD family [Helianthus annuus]KAJ0530990.1 putative transcription factor Znf-LSD family [Helianthus annuus]KAJ0701213.1 putative transcription factor Znf-LSD family [Helianthus annuus]
MYTCGATSVGCSCCHIVNLAQVANQLAQVNCGNCRTTLTYPYGAPSVKCAIFQYITNVNVSTITNLSSCWEIAKPMIQDTHTLTTIQYNTVSFALIEGLSFFNLLQMSNGRIPVPVRPNGTATSGLMPLVSTVSSCFFP